MILGEIDGRELIEVLGRGFHTEKKLQKSQVNSLDTPRFIFREDHSDRVPQVMQLFQVYSNRRDSVTNEIIKN